MASMCLPSSRYEAIKRAVASMFSRAYPSGMVPVDPFELCARLGIKVVPYSNYEGNAFEALLKMSPNGFKVIWPVCPDGSSAPVIFYNDFQMFERIRFTLLHELGHILLGHKQSSDLAEAEANFFAKYAIAPPSLVRVAKTCDYLELAEVFGLSRECAWNSWNYYQKWAHRRGGPTDYESGLAEVFTFVPWEGGGAMLRMRKGA